MKHQIYFLTSKTHYLPKIGENMEKFCEHFNCHNSRICIFGWSVDMFQIAIFVNIYVLDSMFDNTYPNILTTISDNSCSFLILHISW